MALVTVGNTWIGACAYDPQDPQYDCEQPGPYAGLQILHNFPKGSFEKKITVYYYNHYPVHPNFQNSHYSYTENIVPYVQSGYENLDVNPRYLIVKGKPSGWYSMEITLSRDIKPGEYINVGFYSKCYYSRYENRQGVTSFITAAYPHGTPGVSTPLEAVKNGEFFRYKSEPMFSYYTRDYSFYFTYYDAPLSQDYYRTVSSDILIKTERSRSCSYERVKNGYVTCNDLNKPKRFFLRKPFAQFSMKDFQIPMLMFRRKLLGNELFTDYACKKTDFHRSQEIFNTYLSNLDRICRSKRGETSKVINKDFHCNNSNHIRDNQSSISMNENVSKIANYKSLIKHRFSMKDFIIRKVYFVRDEKILLKVRDVVKRFLGIFCGLFDSLSLIDISRRIISYIRIQNQKAKYQTLNKHASNYFRDNSSISEVGAKAISSRTLTRICDSVSFFWDFLRGKIRETPNVVTLFCPMDFEVEIESRI